MAPTKHDYGLARTTTTPLSISPPSSTATADAHVPSVHMPSAHQGAQGAQGRSPGWWAAVPVVVGCLCLGSAAYLVRPSASSTHMSSMFERVSEVHKVVKTYTPSQELHEAGLSFLKKVTQARMTEGKGSMQDTMASTDSMAVSDDDCSEIETLLDECFDDSSDVTSDITCRAVKYLALDEECGYNYTVSTEEVTYMYEFYENNGVCNSSEIVIADCWDSSAVCDVYKDYLYDILDDDFSCDL